MKEQYEKKELYLGTSESTGTIQVLECNLQLLHFGQNNFYQIVANFCSLVLTAMAMCNCNTRKMCDHNVWHKCLIDWRVHPMHHLKCKSSRLRNNVSQCADSLRGPYLNDDLKIFGILGPLPSCLHMVLICGMDFTKPLLLCTEGRFNLCTWLGEICSCSCLTVLPGPAWVLLNKICKD